MTEEYMTMRIKAPAKAVVSKYKNELYKLRAADVVAGKIPKIDASESSAIVYMDEEITRLRARVKELETEVWLLRPGDGTEETILGCPGRGGT
jgi:hypothetical protein